MYGTVSHCAASVSCHAMWHFAILRICCYGVQDPVICTIVSLWVVPCSVIQICVHYRLILNSILSRRAVSYLSAWDSVTS